MTKTLKHRYPSQKPIRKDRVAVAIAILAAIVVIPILLFTGNGPVESEPLNIIDDGAITTSTDDETSTDGTTIDTTSEDGAIPPSSGRFLTHTVEDGETVADVATALGVTVSNLLASNRLFGGEQLQPNQVLYASTEGIVHVIQAGQTLTDIAQSYAVPVQTLSEANDLTDASRIFAGDRVLIPGATSSFWNNAVVLSKGVSTQFIWPLEGDVVSQFGWRIHPVLGERHHHDGIDIDVPEGTVVHAVAGGEVFFYGEQPGYGNLLIIEHGNQFLSFYGHLSDSFVFPGQYVDMGQAVARSGNTGISSGPHLHFELRNGDYPIDPERYLP